MVEYFLKTPNKTRRTFAIIERLDRAHNKTLKLERLDAINALYKSGALTLVDARAQSMGLVKELQTAGRPSPRFSDANQSLFNAYWVARYERRKTAPDSKRSARNKYNRALDSLGGLPITSATIHELQTALDKLPARRQRRAVGCINRLLAFAGRTELLMPERSIARPVRYLTPLEFSRILLHLPVVCHLPAQVAFYTGMRQGEVFAATQYIERDQSVAVTSQLTRSNKLSETKTRRARSAFVLPEGVEVVRTWLAVPMGEREKVRALNWAGIIRRACRAARVPTPCVFHDLRHSYAMELLSRGVSIDLVALSLGNSVTVCQMHYIGYALTSPMGQLLKSLVKKAG